MMNIVPAWRNGSVGRNHFYTIVIKLASVSRNNYAHISNKNNVF